MLSKCNGFSPTRPLASPEKDNFVPAEILISVRPNQTRVAYVEDKVLKDLKIERPTSPTLVGSVFKGKVVRVLPGMQAAFVDIGLDRAAFLYVGDIRTDTPPHESSILFEDRTPEDPETEPSIEPQAENSEAENTAPEPKVFIQDLIKEGQYILVQVAKDPLGTKGARITTHISLPGRHIVYMPNTKHFGVSRKIEDEAERQRLKEVVDTINPDGGVIIRTAGEGANQEHLQSDLEYLNRLWNKIQKSYDAKKSFGLIHSEMDVELRALRDMLKEDVEKIVVDEDEAYKKVGQFVAQFMPKFKQKIELYKEDRPLFDIYDLDIEISRSLGRKVWLKSGGYIVIDEAEALVVIDVNTGRYVGKKDLEDTILKTNLEAIKEIAHQLRIRNCGGIIILDLIDMEKEVNRQRVLEQLEEELKKDSARTAIISMSALGLVEMTRKRIRPSLVSTLCEPCPYCEGNGYIKNKMTVAGEIFIALEREATNRKHIKEVIVICHSDVADWIYEEDSESLDYVEVKLKTSVTFQVDAQFHMEEFVVHIE